jgi:hypothetical protein
VGKRFVRSVQIAVLKVRRTLVSNQVSCAAVLGVKTLAGEVHSSGWFVTAQAVPGCQRSTGKSETRV